MKWGCKHEWKKVTEQVLPSPMEQADTAAQSSFSGPTGYLFFQKKYICILACKKCGKLNKTIEINP